jgi:uncharacterized radical SAM superfamily Fe-S cluster-containing enzyme
MPDVARPYLFYDTATSICPQCWRRAEGKIVFQDDKVWMHKWCRVHGHSTVLMADDVDYYRRSREVFLKPGDVPMRFNTPMQWGCPYDCGLCPDHQQHSCLSILEINDACNLDCPICYAGSGRARATEHKPLEQVLRMLDCIIKNEGEADVVQVSGGEPTLHPDFFKILDECKKRPIRHLMVNTNGVRIASDPAFAEKLASYQPGFELYLQFDSLKPEALKELRGEDLTQVRQKALQRLNALNLSTTLVVTLKRGANLDEIGAILDYAVQQRCVRGVTFQPIQDAGRTEGYDAAQHRLTLTEVRRAMLTQSQLFKAEDILPVPCHPDGLAMAYGLKSPGGFAPLTGMIDPKILIEGRRNTIVYEKDESVKSAVFKLLSLGHGPEGGFERLRDLLCCLPQVALGKGLGYQDLFRVIIMAFHDAHSFDVRSVKRTCVHIAHPDGERLIPFDTYNLFYRGDLEQTRLAPLRREAEALA